jgi:hypothetical protein
MEDCSARLFHVLDQALPPAGTPRRGGSTAVRG